MDHYPEILTKKVGVVLYFKPMIEISKHKANLLTKAAYYYNQVQRAHYRLMESIALAKTAKTDADVIKVMDLAAGKMLVRRVSLSFFISSRLRNIANENSIELKTSINFIPHTDLIKGYIILNSDEEELKVGDFIYFLTNGSTKVITEKDLRGNPDYVLPEVDALVYHGIVRSN